MDKCGSKKGRVIISVRADDDHWRGLDFTPFPSTQVTHTAGTTPGCNLPTKDCRRNNNEKCVSDNKLNDQTQTTRSERLSAHRHSWVRAAVTTEISSRRVDMIAPEAGRGPGVLALTYASYAVAS